MAFKRSAVRFRLAPPSSFWRTHSSLTTLELIRHSRGLRSSRRAFAVSVEMKAALLQRQSRPCLRPSETFSEIRMSVASRQVRQWRETGSSVARGAYAVAERRGLDRDMAQSGQMGTCEGFNRVRVAVVAESTQLAGRSSGTLRGRAAACHRSQPARCQGQERRVTESSARSSQRHYAF